MKIQRDGCKGSAQAGNGKQGLNPNTQFMQVPYRDGSIAPVMQDKNALWMRPWFVLFLFFCPWQRVQCFVPRGYSVTVK